MKVLHVCESLIGGPASYLEEILPFQSRQLLPQNVIALVPESHRSHLGPAVDCTVETYSRTGRNLRSLIALGRAIRGSVRRHQPDIVHLHSSFAGVVGRLTLATCFARTSIVYCAHCWSFDRVPRDWRARLYALVERALARATGAIVNLSPHEDVLLRELGFPPGKARLIVTGLSDLPIERRTPPLGPRAAGMPLRLLFAGRMDAQKGIDLLLREVERIPPERVTLTVIGGRVVDGWDVAVPDCVHLGQWVARETLPDMLAQVDAVVMPSRWEGMPLWALEVLRSGRPLVASNHGVFPHIVRDGVDGVLVDINVPGFMDRALRVLERADLPAMGLAARAAYETKFSHERMNRDLIDLYEVLNDSRRTSGQRLAQTEGEPLASYAPAEPRRGRHP
jgi:glycosyltransferase involved in cell wall biosynthesis